MRAVILILLVWLCDVARSACPSPFVAVGAECLYLSPEHRTWKEAYAECQGLGGYLAVPSSVALLDAFAFPRAGTEGVWIGGTDADCEGDWTYINGDTIDAADWAEGQPDDAHEREDCLELHSDLDPPLNDQWCEVKQQFMCEVDAPCTYDEPKCPPPFTRGGDKCYYLGTTSENWFDARTNCLRLGGDLATPANEEILKVALKRFVFPKANNVWLGARIENLNDEKYRWWYVNGSAISGWAPGMPLTSGIIYAIEFCLAATELVNPPLYNNACGAKLNYVCQADLPCPCPGLSCPEPYTLVGNQCFYLNTTKTTWSGAYNTCINKGASLAIPNDVMALNDFLFPTADSCGVWIGGQLISGKFAYYNGINYKQINPWDWGPGQPDNAHGIEYCLEMKNLMSPPLSDNACHILQAFVCEVPASCPCLDCWDY